MLLLKPQCLNLHAQSSMLYMYRCTLRTESVNGMFFRFGFSTTKHCTNFPKVFLCVVEKNM